jgi:hypothetical protein
MLSKTAMKLNSALCKRAKITAAKLGYSSPEEFIEHAIEKELSKHEQPDSKEEVARKLKGLGYLD